MRENGVSGMSAGVREQLLPSGVLPGRISTGANGAPRLPEINSPDASSPDIWVVLLSAARDRRTARAGTQSPGRVLFPTPFCARSFT
jgi:hypothetical protein